MNIGIIGAGNVGGALGRRWVQSGHTIKFGVPNPGDEKTQALVAESGGSASAATPAEAFAFGEVVVLATPWGVTQEALKGAGDLSGKILLDCTNPIAADFSALEIGQTTSGGEMVSQWAPGARVVKIFNTVGANIMADPQFQAQRPVMLFCGDDGEAKEVASQLATTLGFEAIDAGPLIQARLLEPMAWLWITMALKYGQGREIAWALLRR